MKIKYALALFVTFGVLLAGTTARSQELTKEQKILRILALSDATKSSDQVIEQMRTMMSSQMPPGMPSAQAEQMELVMDKTIDLVKSKLGLESLRSQYVAIYDATYTAEEVDGLLAFYESPAGRAMIEKMPLILEKTMALMQTEMAKLLPELQKIILDSRRDPATTR